MKKGKILATALSLLFVLGAAIVPANDVSTLNVSAETSETSEVKTSKKNGWYNSNGKKIYYADGKKIVSKTKKIDGKIYLFDEKGYLLTDGYHTVNGNKYYSNEDGTVKCNKWVTQKSTKSGNVYYYASSTGKVVEYSFKKKNSTYCLYVNGKLSTSKDIPLNTVFNLGQYSVESRCGYFKVGSHFYHLNYSSVEECVVCDRVNEAKYESYNSANNKFYDLGSKKELGNLLGLIQFNSKGYVSDGVLFNASKRTDYVIQNGKSQSTKITEPLIFTEYYEDLNSVGGLDYTLTFANNSGKTINYVYFNVHVVNRVGDKVSDTITGKKSFVLKDTGPYAPGDISSGTWGAFMYNYSANKVVIDSIEIKYKDGTSKIIKGSDIIDMYELVT